MGHRITHSEQWWSAAPPTVLRCTAHYKDGSPCRREASAGTTVCGQHGAMVPAVRAAAATRIQMSVDEAAAKLIEWMNDPTTDLRDRIKIAHDLLDRGGLAATSKMLVGVVTDDPVEALFRDLLSREGALVPAAAPAFTEIQLGSAYPADLTHVIEGEVLDGPPPPLHTVHVRGSMSSAPPRSLNAGLQRARVLRDLP